MRQATRTTAWIFAAGLLGWIVSAAIGWLSGAPLGHDEAQYALAARDALSGAAPRWFYVSSGMNAVAGPGVLAGGSEIALRSVPFVLGIGFVLATAELARRAFGPTTAAWTVAVLAGTRSFMRLSSELLSDLPATTFLVAGTAVLVTEVTREGGPRWRTVVAAPLFAAALYLRYASCVPIAIVGLAALAVGARAIMRRPGPVVATALVFCALLIPHLRTSIAATGSALGILLDSRGVPHQSWLGEGLVTYLTTNPFKYYGLLAPPLMLAGVLATLRRGCDRRAVLLWIVVVADIVAIGLISHAQPRYIFFGLALLVVLGVDAVRRFVEARPPRARRALAAAAAIAIAIACVLVARSELRYAPHRSSTLRATLAAAEVMRTDAAGARCYISMPVAFAQLEWYSGCTSSMWPWDMRAPDEPVYVVRTPPSPIDPAAVRGKPRTILEHRATRVTRFDP